MQGHSSMVTADAVVTQSQLRYLKSCSGAPWCAQNLIDFTGNLPRTKLSPQVWKAPCSGLEGAFPQSREVIPCRAHGSDETGSITNSSKAVSGALHASVPFTSLGGLAEKGALWFQLLPSPGGWGTSLLGVATPGQDQEPCTGDPILYSVWTGSLVLFEDKDWGVCDLSSVWGFKQILLQRLCCRGGKADKTLFCFHGFHLHWAALKMDVSAFPA